MEKTANDLKERILQLNSMVTLAKNIPPSRQKDIIDVTNSLMLNVGSRTLPAEANVKLSNSLGKLKTFAEEEERRGENFVILKNEIWEPFTIIKKAS